jgi:rubrerythrin
MTWYHVNKRGQLVDGANSDTGLYKAKDVYKGLNDIPSADVAPVRHGKWTHKPDVYGVVYCSECNYELHANSTSFCPNCGAKMDGKRKE